MKTFARLATGLVTALLVAFLTGCASQVPPVRPDASNRFWMLMTDMPYNFADGVSITIPAGFVTDFASVPQLLWSFGLGPNGRHSGAAVVHDYLYWSQICDKDQSDAIMAKIMGIDDVGAIKQKLIHAGVYFGGAGSWSKNEADRKKGLLRVVPERWRAIPPGIEWEDYQSALFEAGYREHPFKENPAFCSVGNYKMAPLEKEPADKASKLRALTKEMTDVRLGKNP